jgi:hypothetical protein
MESTQDSFPPLWGWQLDFLGLFVNPTADTLCRYRSARQVFNILADRAKET